MSLTREQLSIVERVAPESRGTLRDAVETIVAQHSGDPRQASLEICRLFEDRVGLAGNGWFDDDQETLEFVLR